MTTKKKTIQEGDTSGSTALVVLFDGRSRCLLVANVGDSRCVASRAGQAARLSSDHRLSRSDERERVSVRLFAFCSTLSHNSTATKANIRCCSRCNAPYQRFVWDLIVETDYFGWALEHSECFKSFLGRFRIIALDVLWAVLAGT